MSKKQIMKWDGKVDAEHGRFIDESKTLYEGSDIGILGYHQLEINDPRGQSFITVRWRNVGALNKDSSIQFMVEETQKKKVKNVTTTIYFDIPLKMADLFIKSLSKVAPDSSKK